MPPIILGRVIHLTDSKGEFGKKTEKDRLLATLTFGRAGCHISIHSSVSVIA